MCVISVRTELRRTSHVSNALLNRIRRWRKKIHYFINKSTNLFHDCSKLSVGCGGTLFTFMLQLASDVCGEATSRASCRHLLYRMNKLGMAIDWWNTNVVFTAGAEEIGEQCDDRSGTCWRQWHVDTADWRSYRPSACRSHAFRCN